VIYRFGACKLDTDRLELWRGSDPVTVEPQVFSLLLHLIENKDRVVSKDDLLASVWQGRIVSDATLSSRINAARRAVGDNGKEQAVIRTIARRGFRFIAELAEDSESGHGREETASTTLSVERIGAIGSIENGTLSLLDKPSIAILPFDNMSGDPEQEYFADGITEDIIAALSSFRSLLVIARNSTFTYKGQATEVAQVARDLDVRYVLEGSVRKARNRVRVAAQLIDSETGGHIWAGHYDRDLGDIFALQDEVTERVVTTVMPALDLAERQRSARKVPENMDVWDCYQRGMWHTQRLTRDDLTAAQDLFDRATRLDPLSALGFTGLAWLGTAKATMHMLTPADETVTTAYEAGKTAVALDDLDASAHSALGWLATLRREWFLGEAEFRRAIELNPNLAWGHAGLGAVCVYLGRLEEGERELDVSERLNPRDPYGAMWDNIRASSQFQAGRYEDSLATTERTLQKHPRWVVTITLQAASLSMLGELARARALQAQVREIKPDYRPVFIEFTIPVADPGFFAVLRRALEAAEWEWE
jgi:TolB-like protein